LLLLLLLLVNMLSNLHSDLVSLLLLLLNNCLELMGGWKTGKGGRNVAAFPGRGSGQVEDVLDTHGRHRRRRGRRSGRRVRDG